MLDCQVAVENGRILSLKICGSSADFHEFPWDSRGISYPIKAAEGAEVFTRTLTGKTLTNDRNHRLINRVHDYPDELFASFAEQDRFYAKRELQAYIGFATSQFRGSAEYAGSLGLASGFDSLPRQWHLVKQRYSSKINTPVFEWTSVGVPSDLDQADNKIFTTPFQYWNWRPGLNSSGNLRVIRPRGRPLFAFQIGHTTIFEDDDLQPSEATTLIQEVMMTMAQSLRLGDFFEVLFFIDGEQVTFAVANPSLRKAQNNADVQERIKTYLMTLDGATS